ncbi:MAG: hypothetical protein LBK26_03375 [Rickettsiales bacterium]|nr:hypothetical protein [Rickettsiales bacterium]
MKKFCIFLAAVAVLLGNAPAIADDANDSFAADIDVIETKSEPVNPKIKFPRGVQLGLGASATSGINGWIGYANKDFESFWWKRLGVRFDFATAAPLKSTINSAMNSAISGGLEIDNLTISDIDLSMQHFGALVDFYPFGNTWFLGGLRISGGYITGNTSFFSKLSGKANGVPGGPMEFELNGTEYRYNGGDINGTAKADWKYSGPYLGGGFDLGLFWGIKIYMDAGIVFTNKTAALSLNVPVNEYLEVWKSGAWENISDDLSGTLETEFNNAQNIALKDANDELDKLKMYPMIKLGFMYRF